MEFFAFIGLITVTVLIYEWVKSWKGDDEEEKEVCETMEEDVFVLDTNSENLFKPVFKPLPATNNQSAIDINLELKRVGSYARLYYNLKNVYGDKAVPTFAIADERIKLAIYDIEMIRREIYETYFVGKKCARNIDPFDMDDTFEMLCRVSDIRTASIPLIFYYDIAREECFKIKRFKDDGYFDFDPSGLPRTARLIKMQAVHDAEVEHFRGNPVTKEVYEKSANKYLSSIFSQKTK